MTGGWVGETIVVDGAGCAGGGRGREEREGPVGRVWQGGAGAGLG